MPTFQPAPGVLAEQIDGRALLIDATSSELITLNPVGSVVWDAMSHGAHTIDALVAAVADAFDAPADELADDVAGFLDELVAASLVVTA